jgi:DNA-binding NtrC family response regulator
MQISKPVILLVEDDFLSLLDARIALEDAGYEVLEATHAQAALDHFNARDDIAAVISDVAMPGSLDGIALIDLVRAVRPDLPVLLTTGFSGIPGLDGIPLITKPYRAYQLVDHIIARTSIAA